MTTYTIKIGFWVRAYDSFTVDAESDAAAIAQAKPQAKAAMEMYSKPEYVEYEDRREGIIVFIDRHMPQGRTEIAEYIAFDDDRIHPPEDNCELFTNEQEQQLLANAERLDRGERFGLWPVVKLFTPDLPLRWLVVGMNPEEPNWLYGVVDDGLKCCGYDMFRQSDLLNIRGPSGGRVQPDLQWTPRGPISAYVKASKGKRLVDRLPLPRSRKG
jgi:hypothetical protein